MPKVREYLRLRPCDADTCAWPTAPEGFKASFLEATASFYAVAAAAMHAVGSTPVAQGTTSHAAAGTALLGSDQLEAVDAVGATRSGLNLIHYYPQEEEDGEASAAAATVDVCSVHEDTGLLTFGVCTEEPGLQVWDRAAGAFVAVEALGRPRRDLFCFVGKKFSMFTGNDAVVATPHRVLVKPGVRRDSTVFLLDVAQ